MMVRLAAARIDLITELFRLIRSLLSQSPDKSRVIAGIVPNHSAFRKRNQWEPEKRPLPLFQIARVVSFGSSVLMPEVASRSHRGHCRSENIPDFGKLYGLTAGNFDLSLSEILENFIRKRHAVKGGYASRRHPGLLKKRILLFSATGLAKVMSLLSMRHPPSPPYFRAGRSRPRKVIVTAL